MNEIDKKYAALGGKEGVLGAVKGPETTAPDGKGRYRFYQYGAIYWHPDTGAHEVHGAIINKWGSLKWEKGVLGYPTTDETSCPDKVGRYNHFQHGSIYWKPTVSASEVHGLIRQRWAQDGWERNAALGYPISNELTTKTGSKNRYNDFENGVIFWKYGSKTAKVLNKLTIGGASKSAKEMLAAIGKVLAPAMPKTVDGHKLKIEKGPYLGGPAIPGQSPRGGLDLIERTFPTTDYFFDARGLHTRHYKVTTELAIDVPVLPDITVTLTIYIEIVLDKKARKVFAIPRYWKSRVVVPFPTTISVKASTINAKVKAAIQPQMNKRHDVADIPAGVNLLAVKPMPNGDLNVYMEPLG